MAGLAYALRTLPTGTAHAVWVGIGASLTVAYGMWTSDEPVSIAKVLLTHNRKWAGGARTRDRQSMRSTLVRHARLTCNDATNSLL